MPSSLTPALSRPLLSEVFASVPDLRDPRGVRRRLSTVLTIAQAAVAAGARTLLALGEWAADVDREALTRLGIEAQGACRRNPPSGAPWPRWTATT